MDIARPGRATKPVGIGAINGEWVEVPEEAVVYNAGNPFSEAVVWYTNFHSDINYLNNIYIRCFVPGTGV